MTDTDFMQLAIAKAEEGIALGQSPFGAVIVRDGQVIASAHNTVWLTTDPTAHAEVNAIRLAAKVLQTIRLDGCTMYATCEPCPMCLTATHWAKIDRLVFGATIADAAAAGFSELHMPAQELARCGGGRLIVHVAEPNDACVALFRKWRQMSLGSAY